MNRRFIQLLAIVAAVIFVPGAFQEAEAAPAVTLRVATLAPKGSSWMRVFEAWNNSLKQETNNALQLQFYAGGAQGDEKDFIRKIRAGQMDGAVVTATGLSQIVKPVLVLGAPGLITEYAQLDKVRGRFKGQFEEKFEAGGYTLLGWGDVGQARLFSTQKITRPSQLRTVRPWAWRDDVIYSEFLKAVGANPIRLGVPEVYPALQTGMVDTVPSSALSAVALQWFSRLKYMSKQPMGVIGGATILSKSKFDALSAEHQAVLTSTGVKAHHALRTSIRRDDAKAYRTLLSRGIQEVDTDPHKAEWDAKAKETRDRLAGRLYPKSMLARIEAALQ